MPAYQCYLCDDVLNEHNRSKEHILPNSIGGRLKSDRLLCKTCNTTTGQLYDDVFAEFSVIWASKHHIQRERGNVPNFKAIRISDGAEIVVKPGWKIELLHPVIQYLSGNAINITSSSIQRHNQELARLKKEYLKDGWILDVLQTVADHTERKVDFLSDRIFNQDLLVRAACKIFANFYIYSDGDIREIHRIITFLKEDVENYYGWFCDLNWVHSHYGEKPYHLLAIRGDRKQKAIYAYLEIFGEKGFTGLLNGQYQGEDFQFDLVYDPVGLATIPFDGQLYLDKSQLMKLIKAKPGLTSSDNSLKY